MKITTPSPYTKASVLEKIFGIVAGIASILAFLKWDDIVPSEAAGLVYAGYVVFILNILLLYVYSIHRRKLHRYAEASTYHHYINHTVRDALNSLKHKIAKDQFTDAELEEFHDTTISLLDAISTCFSILTGTQCGVCVKEHTEDGLRVAYRDSISKCGRGKPDNDREPHQIKDDTPCSSLILDDANHSRCYCCNDVVTQWKLGNYKSPSFIVYGGEPETLTIFSYIFVKSWPLHYKSALVVPLRYLKHKASNRMIPARSTSRSTSCHYWGFLCIDAKRRNIFDYQRQEELAAAFADILYIYFNEIHEQLDIYTQPLER